MGFVPIFYIRSILNMSLRETKRMSLRAQRGNLNIVSLRAQRGNLVGKIVIARNKKECHCEHSVAISNEKKGPVPFFIRKKLNLSF